MRFMAGTVHEICVSDIATIEQNYPPTITLFEASWGEKLYPVMTNGYPPPIEPEDIESPVITILY